MTTKLYWHDSQLTEFSAQVVDCFVQDGRQVVVLDQSAFYPGGGGQPYDTGSINAARVTAIDAELTMTIPAFGGGMPLSGLLPLTVHPR